MAQTDTRTGFRLPWTAERGEGEPPADGDGSDTQETETPDMIDTTQTSEPADTAATSDPGEADHGAPAAAVAELAALQAAGAGLPPRRASKFMADLSRAMQTAAETARDETMLRFEAETKSAIEEIQSASGDEAAALRRRADDDVAAVREWSKTEIAHIREETEQRIAQRKAALDGEMEAHAAVVETRIERVGTTVTAFQSEMEDFFQRLLAEEDPTRIATMAETMPEPPSLVAIAAAITEADPVPLIVVESSVEAPAEAPADEPAVEATAEASAETETEASAETEVAAETETPADTEAPAVDFAAAEAEAAEFTGEVEEERAETSAPVEMRLASDPAGIGAAVTRSSDARTTTRVVVLGLVSVASIASFKRDLGRTQGVAAIGVASGPDGEFVFTVTHDEKLDLADTITSLPGYDANINSQTENGLEISAHDPDAAD
jgi:hypothetical protein